MQQPSTWIPAAEPAEIDGHQFQLRAMPFADALATYGRFQKVLSGWDGEHAVCRSMGPFLFVGMQGGLSEADITFFTDKFGAYSTVTLPGDRMLPLTSKDARNELFSGNLSLMFAWLDASAEFHFGDIMGKVSGALSELKAERAPKTE